MQAKIMSLEAQLNKANQQIKELEGKSTTDCKTEVKPDGNEASGEPTCIGIERFIFVFLASAYYTPEQLSGYYDQLISAGYMTKEQAKEALDQVRKRGSYMICEIKIFLGKVTDK